MSWDRKAADAISLDALEISGMNAYSHGMNGIDILTRDIATMRNGARFASWGYDRHGTEWPISGDMLAKIRDADALPDE